MARRKLYDSEKARRAAQSAWGTINTQRKIVNGVFSFDTWGHGGYVVIIPQDEIQPWMDVEYYWNDGTASVVFEEDCAWAFVPLWKPEVARKEVERGEYLAFKSVDDLYKNALRTAKVWHTMEQWEAFVQTGLSAEAAAFLPTVEDVESIVDRDRQPA